MYAQFLDSMVCGGWFVAETEQEAVAFALATRDKKVSARYRHNHRLGGGVEVSKKDVAHCMGGGGHPVLKRHAIWLAPGLDVKSADVSRGTGGWDYTNIQGL